MIDYQVRLILSDYDSDGFICIEGKANGSINVVPNRPNHGLK